MPAVAADKRLRMAAAAAERVLRWSSLEEDLVAKAWHVVQAQEPEGVCWRQRLKPLAQSLLVLEQPLELWRQGWNLLGHHWQLWLWMQGSLDGGCAKVRGYHGIRYTSRSEIFWTRMSGQSGLWDGTHRNWRCQGWRRWHWRPSKYHSRFTLLLAESPWPHLEVQVLWCNS